ncbi:MAG TPA: isochorismate synthase [bacterium]|jgi:menaquinone-specific isochorismate synthase
MNVINHTYSLPHVQQISCPPVWRAWDGLAAAYAPAFLWRERAGQEVVLALGAAGVYSSLTECRKALASDHGAPLAFGMVAFDPRSILLAPWEGFQSSLFVVPKVLVRWKDGIASIWGQEKALADVVDALQNPPPPRRLLDVDGGRAFSEAEWTKAVRAMQAHIAAGAITKAVLARDSIRESAAPVQAGYVLERLASSTPDCYLFAHGMNGATFLGASPERLFRLDRSMVETESLAGTRPRGKTAREDERLAQELLHSAKENIEQNIVTQFLQQGLAELCVAVSDDLEPHVRKLAGLQHLHTRIHGQLKDNVTPDDVLHALHPTPAVCGMPKEQAREIIAELEPVPRGLYAGAIGWMDAERAELAVAIRSALLKDRVARVFAGAGIIAASDAKAEWRETALKMKPMLSALNCEEL